MKSPSSFALAATSVAATVLFFFARSPGTMVAIAATPPPSPPPIGSSSVTPQPNAPLLPTPSATFPVGSPHPSATPSPRPDARKGLDGVWEVQIQHPNTTDYTHFKLQQQGDALTGTYLDSQNKKHPLAGNVDGSEVRLIVSMPDGTTLLLEGKLDGTTDMVGMLTAAGGQVPFTAQYRAKSKWIDNVNAAPGGVPQQQGGYTPP